MEWIYLLLLSFVVVTAISIPLFCLAIVAASSTLAWKGVRILRWCEPTFALVAGIPVVLLGGVMHQYVHSVILLSAIFFILMCGISVFQLLFDSTLTARSHVFDACIANGTPLKRSMIHGVILPSSAAALDTFRIHIPHAVLAVLLAQWLKGTGAGGLLKSSILASDSDRWVTTLSIAIGLLIIDTILSRFVVEPFKEVSGLASPDRTSRGLRVRSTQHYCDSASALTYSVTQGIAPRIVAFIAFFAGWEFLARMINSPWTFKGPFESFHKLGQSSYPALQAACYTTGAATVGGIMVGFVGGAIFGVGAYLIAVFSEEASFAWSTLPKFTRSFFSAIIFLVQSVPILVWLPLLERIFGETRIAVVIASLIVGSRVFQCACRADSFLPKRLADCLHVNAVALRRRLLQVDRRNVGQSILLGLEGALPLAVSGVLIGEFFVSGEGLGGIAYREMAQNKEIPLIVITVCALISMLTREIFLVVLRRLSV